MHDDPQDVAGQPLPDQPPPTNDPLPQPELPPTVLSDQDLTAAVLILLQRTEGENGPAASPFGHIVAPRKRAYLIALALCGRVLRACKIAGVSHQALYSRPWQEDSEFQEAVTVARRMACDIIEDEIWRRAVEGVVKPTGFYKGEPGAWIREYSDVLLIFRAKGEMPDKYKDRLELKGSLANLDLNQLSDAQISRLAAGEHPYSVLGGGALALPPGKQAEPDKPLGDVR